MSTKLDKKTRDQLVDKVLEYNRTPRRELFEYPYNEYESRDLIANAEALVKSIVAILDK